MPIEIKELVIRTVLEGGTSKYTPGVQAGPEKKNEAAGEANKGSSNVEKEVKKQLKKYKADIIKQVIEAVNDGLKRQHER